MVLHYRHTTYDNKVILCRFQLVSRMMDDTIHTRQEYSRSHKSLGEREHCRQMDLDNGYLTQGFYTCNARDHELNAGFLPLEKGEGGSGDRIEAAPPVGSINCHVRRF